MFRRLLHAQGPIVHALAGLLVPFWFYGWTQQTPDLRVLIACVWLALLPDIDSQASFVGRLLPFISAPLERRFGHRQVTHSLLALLLVTAVTFLAFRADWWLLTAAYGSHLMVDMLVGYTGVPLLWPSQIRFYLLTIRPTSTGELFLGCVIACFLLFPLFDVGRARVAAFIPREEIALAPTATPTPTPTPRIVTIRVDNVYDLDREILVSVGDHVQRGQIIADLATYRRLIATATPTPTPTATATPTPPSPTPFPTPDPLLLAELENRLQLARARYRRAIATTTPNPLWVNQVNELAVQIQQREDCLYGHAQSNSSDDWRAWNCRQELDRLATRGTAVALTAQPRSPDVLDANVAYYQLKDAEIAYAQAIARLTPPPTPTATPPITPTPFTIHHSPFTIHHSTSPTPLPDHTRVTAFITGRVIGIQVISVRGNAAAVEIRLLVPYDPRYHRPPN